MLNIECVIFALERLLESLNYSSFEVVHCLEVGESSSFIDHLNKLHDALMPI